MTLKVYLFMATKGAGLGHYVRPVSWVNPNAPISPMYIENEHPELIGWLRAHHYPRWDDLRSAIDNCKVLADTFGKWPEPIDTKLVKEITDKDLNDPIPF